MIHLFEIVLTSCLLGTSVITLADSKEWVGQFRIDAELATKDFVVGRPVMYTIVIAGSGERGPAPNLSDHSRFSELFDIVGPRESRAGDADRIRDRFEFQLALKSEKHQRIPPFRWGYTNARTGKRETLLVEGMDINVKDRATVESAEPFHTKEGSVSTWMYVLVPMGIILASLSVGLVVWRTGRDESVSMGNEGLRAWEDRARAVLGTWKSARSPDEIDADLRAFQACVAERLGLDPSGSDVGDIKASVGSRFSASRGEVLCRLLDDLDSVRFAGEGDLRAIKERAVAWLESELRELD